MQPFTKNRARLFTVLVAVPMSLTMVGVVLAWQRPAAKPRSLSILSTSSASAVDAVAPGGGLAPAAPAGVVAAADPTGNVSTPPTLRRMTDDWRLHPYEGTKVTTSGVVEKALHPVQLTFLDAYSRADLVPVERMKYFDWLIDRADSLRVIGWNAQVQSFTANARGYKVVLSVYPLLSSARAGKATYTPDRILETYSFAGGKFRLEGVAAPENRLRLLFHH